ELGAAGDDPALELFLGDLGMELHADGRADPVRLEPAALARAEDRRAVGKLEDVLVPLERERSAPERRHHGFRLSLRGEVKRLESDLRLDGPRDDGAARLGQQLRAQAHTERPDPEFRNVERLRAIAGGVSRRERGTGMAQIDLPDQAQHELKAGTLSTVDAVAMAVAVLSPAMAMAYNTTGAALFSGTSTPLAFL